MWTAFGQAPSAQPKSWKPGPGPLSSTAAPVTIATAEHLAGWRVYATNTPAQRLSLTDAVQCYRQEWQSEQGGLLAITPLFLRHENRIRGLLVLLGIVLRLLTLTEFVVQRDLAATGEKLKRLYAGNHNHATAQSTVRFT